MSLTTDHRLYIESQVAARRKSIGIAYALWFFLGVFSAHRFYLDRPGSAIAQLVLNFLIVGLIWTIADAFLIPGMIRKREEQMRQQLYAIAGGA